MEQRNDWRERVVIHVTCGWREKLGEAKKDANEPSMCPQCKQENVLFYNLTKADLSRAAPLQSASAPNWNEWVNSEESRTAQEWRQRIDAGETGNRNNPIAASHIAFDAGVRRGRYEAICALAELINGYFAKE